MRECDKLIHTEATYMSDNKKLGLAELLFCQRMGREKRKFSIPREVNALLERFLKKKQE